MDELKGDIEIQQFKLRRVSDGPWEKRPFVDGSTDRQLSPETEVRRLLLTQGGSMRTESPLNALRQAGEGKIEKTVRIDLLFLRRLGKLAFVVGNQPKLIFKNELNVGFPPIRMDGQAAVPLEMFLLLPT